MKLMIYYLIIFHLLIVRADNVQYEPEALSYMSIIPTLISNSRFIQEDIKFNQTLPLINLDQSFEANISNCSRDIQTLVEDLRARKSWALKTLDAWGKYPSGIMQGNIYWIGSPYECGHHLRGLNNTVVEQPFRTRTCVVGNGFGGNIRPIYGVCVPQSCNATEVINYINSQTFRIPYIRRYIHLTNDSVRCIDARSYDAKAILTIILLTLIALLILVATGLHVIYGRRHDVKSEIPGPTGYESIVDRTTTVGESTITTETVTTTTINTSLPADDESTPLVTRTEPAVDSAADKLVSSCSLINNYRILKYDTQPTNFACLNGIRVLSLCWVILGHTFLYAAMYSDNIMTLFNWTRQLWFQTILQGTFSIDTFFVLSGLLTSFLFFVTRIENENFSILKFLLNHYVYRYLRYTIFYAIILLIYISLSPYFGQGGPIYPNDGTETSKCRSTWWKNLLYINNFFHYTESCMPITWFLAVYMQFHWVAPLFLLSVAWKWFLGMFVVLAFILVDIICTSVIVSKNDYDHGALTPFYAYNQSNTTHNYMNDVYIKPWCRIAPYAVGLAVGYILHYFSQRSNTLTWESILPQRRSSRYNRIQQIFVWIVALVILSLCVFGTYGDYNDRPLTRSGRITFLVLSRLGWAIGLSMIIISCVLGRGGLINRFLSHRIFKSLSKLTYGAYLWHSLVVFVNYLSRDQPNHYTIANILFNFVIHVLLSYGLAFLTFLFIELPTIRLLKTAFQRRTIAYN